MQDYTLHFQKGDEEMYAKELMKDEKFLKLLGDEVRYTKEIKKLQEQLGAGVTGGMTRQEKKDYEKLNEEEKIDKYIDWNQNINEELFIAAEKLNETADDIYKMVNFNEVMKNRDEILQKKISNSYDGISKKEEFINKLVSNECELTIDKENKIVFIRDKFTSAEAAVKLSDIDQAINCNKLRDSVINKIASKKNIAIKQGGETKNKTKSREI